VRDQNIQNLVILLIQANSIDLLQLLPIL
jgi:hypothetical protein